jgi:hypothetical protein
VVLQVKAYGFCVATQDDGMAKGSCQKEFAALQLCAQQVVSEA